MARYAARRVAWALPTLFLVATLTFFLLRGMGGSLLRHGRFLGGSNAGWVKYGDVQRTVGEIVDEAAPVSLELGLLAAAWAIALGLPLGVLAAVRAGSWLDTSIRLLSTVGLGVPVFLTGTLLVYAVAVRGGWLPTSGWGESWKQAVLPSFTLALLPAAWIVRLLRGSLLDVLGSDYVRAAGARGLSRPRVVGVHALRNAALPALTAAGPLVAYLITGSFVVETVFAIPGLGRYFIVAAGARDYPVVLGITVLLAAVVVLANLVVDLVHASLDPRVREAVS